MRTILIIGAGRSASSLIQYLLDKSYQENLHLIIGDLSLALAKHKTNNHPNATAISLDVFDAIQRNKAIQNADIIIYNGLHLEGNMLRIFEKLKPYKTIFSEKIIIELVKDVI